MAQITVAGLLDQLAAVLTGEVLRPASVVVATRTVKIRKRLHSCPCQSMFLSDVIVLYYKKLLPYGFSLLPSTVASGTLASFLPPQCQSNGRREAQLCTSVQDGQSFALFSLRFCILCNK